MQSATLPVLVYDGDCGFCTSWARRVEAFLGETTRVVGWQELGDDGLARLGLTLEDVAEASWWVDPDGRGFGGAASVARALIAIGGWGRLLGTVLRVPPVSWLATATYNVVVRYRHRLPGANVACRRSELVRQPSGPRISPAASHQAVGDLYPDACAAVSTVSPSPSFPPR